MLWHTAGGIQQHVLPVTLRYPWTLCVAVLVFLSLDALVHLWRAESLRRLLYHHHVAVDADHVSVQLSAVDVGITPVYIRLSVIVYHHGWVDIVP